MNPFRVSFVCLLALSVLAIGCIGTEVDGSSDHPTTVQSSLEDYATLLKSLHEANSDAQLSTEASVGANFNGRYPYPPGAVPGGGFQIPISGTAVVGPPGTGASGFNCANIIQGWNPVGTKMFGVALYRVTDAVTGVGSVRGLWAYSGDALHPQPAAPLAGTFAQHAYVATGTIGGWDPANPDDDVRDVHNQAVRTAFAGNRKCFATPEGPGAGAAICRSDADGVITKTFVGGASERGFPAGTCALSKIALSLVDGGIPAARIICAAEMKPDGWGRARSNTPPHNRVARLAREIVSSCVTCQQAIPMLLAPICVIPPVAGPAHALGTCTGRAGGRLLEGETCSFSCADGYSLTTAPTTVTCTNGVAVAAGAQTCTRSCPLPIINNMNAGGCVGAVAGAVVNGRLVVGQTCTWTCNANYVGETAAGGAGPLTQTCNANAAGAGAVPTISAAPRCRAPCTVPALAPQYTTNNGPLANNNVPPRCVSAWPTTLAIHGVGCQFSCQYGGGAVTATCNDGHYGAPPACPGPPPPPQQQPQQQQPAQQPPQVQAQAQGPQGGGARAAVIAPVVRAVVGGGGGRVGGAGAPAPVIQQPAPVQNGGGGDDWQVVRGRRGGGRRGYFRQLSPKNRMRTKATGVLQP